jgi:hypothetical protein
MDEMRCAVCWRLPHPCDDPDCVPLTSSAAERNAVSAFALELLVEAGHISQEKVAAAIAIALKATPLPAAPALSASAAPDHGAPK